MMRRDPFVEGEFYHIYNRGAHKSAIFTSDGDYARFMFLLHIANNSEPIHLGNLFASYKRVGKDFIGLFEEPVDKELVDVVAYCLMPNHFHLVLREKAEGGISTYMRKVATAYTMYFNAKYDHGGTLFQGRFKNRHISSDPYFQWIFSYVHLNPVSLIEKEWKEKGIRNVGAVRKFIDEYKYSSHADYVGRPRSEKVILSLEHAPAYIKGKHEIGELVRWNNFAREFSFAEPKI